MTNEINEVSNAVSRFFAAVDRFDWDAVNAIMTDPFHIDYSSFTGEEPLDRAPEEITGAWAGHLPHLDSVHHQIGNLIVEVDGERAEVQCHGTASHYLADHPGGDLQYFVGTYDLSLVNRDGHWKLSMMRFNFKYASGNMDIAYEAQRRSQSKTQSEEESGK